MPHDPQKHGLGKGIEPFDPTNNSLPPFIPTDPIVTARIARQAEDMIASHAHTYDPKRIFGYDPWHSPVLQQGRHVASAILRMHRSHRNIAENVSMNSQERAHCVLLLRTCGCVVVCRPIGRDLYHLSSSRRLV